MPEPHDLNPLARFGLNPFRHDVVIDTHMQPDGSVIATVRLGTRVIRACGQPNYGFEGPLDALDLFIAHTRAT